MTGHQSLMPLAVGLVVSVVVHGAGASFLAKRLIDQPGRPKRNLSKHQELVLPVPPRNRIGRDLPQPSSVAWIAYDHFRELVAPQSTTEQPALQQQVDPVPNAPMPLDPTSPSDQQVSIVQEASAAKPPLQPEQLDAGGGAVHDPTQLGIVLKQDRKPPAKVSGRIPAQEPKTFKQADTKQTQSVRSGAAKPTAAPRSDRESSPVRLKPGSESVVPGAVLVGQGIEIKTVQPRFSMIARISTVPNNPVARIVFDSRDGRVINAILIKSSGYPNIDGPVLASLYKWRAQGEKLRRRNRPFELGIELILNGQ